MRYGERIKGKNVGKEDVDKLMSGKLNCKLNTGGDQQYFSAMITVCKERTLP